MTPEKMVDAHDALVRMVRGLDPNDPSYAASGLLDELIARLERQLWQGPQSDPRVIGWRLKDLGEDLDVYELDAELLGKAQQVVADLERLRPAVANAA